MKELSGRAAIAIAASPAECIALVAAVDRYPTWYPDVIREVEVLERDADGVPKRARAKVHLSVGPLANDFDFVVTVDAQPAAVIVSRVQEGAGDEHRLDIHWQVRPGELGVDLLARLDVPRFLPVGGAGDSVAQGFVAAAKRVLDGSSAHASASSS